MTKEQRLFDYLEILKAYIMDESCKALDLNKKELSEYLDRQVEYLEEFIKEL